MPNTTTSPNMNLSIPVVSVDPGPDWANNLNSCFSIIDQHNHSAGSGVQISQAGINLSPAASTFDSLNFNASNAYGLRSVRFTVQPSALALAGDLACLYAAGAAGNLFFNDGAGNQIQITSGGTVNATSSGIASGTATASFSGGVLIVNAATNTPANIQVASVLLGNNVANSKYLTLSPPNAMAANYGLTLPSIPGVTSIMAIDTSGNITGAYTVDGTTIAISAGVIGVAAGGIGTTQLANGSVTRPKQSAVGQQISSSSGSFSTTSASFTAVTNLSVTITTSGRPVMLMLQPDGNTSNLAILDTFGSGGPNYSFFRGSTQLGLQSAAAASAGVGNLVQPFLLDTPTAGTYTYTFKIQGNGSNSSSCSYYVLVAYEL